MKTFYDFMEVIGFVAGAGVVWGAIHAYGWIGLWAVPLLGLVAFGNFAQRDRTNEQRND